MLGKIYLVHVQWCYLFFFLSLGLRTQWKKKSNIVRKINKKNIAAFALKYFRVFQDRLDIMFFLKEKSLNWYLCACINFHRTIELGLQEIFNHQNIVQKFCFLEKKVVFCKVSEKKIIHSDDILMYALFWNTLL